MKRALVPAGPPRYLLALDRARRALAEAKTVDELKDLRDYAATVGEYVKRRHVSREFANDWAEFKLRAERRLGELLAATVRHEGGRPEKLSDGTTVLPDGISRDQSSTWQRIADLPEKAFEEYIAETKTDPDGELTTAGAARLVTRLFNANVLFSSESTEWYTPTEYIEAARRVMGGIDLDPASSEEANRTVKAAEFYTRGEDGLSRRWHGRVWLNPPYSGAAPAFIDRLLECVGSGDVSEAIVLLSAHTTDTTWFQPLFDHTLCFTDHRLQFLRPGGEPSAGSPMGSVFIHLGPDDQARVFAKEFARFGNIVRRWPRGEAA